MSAIAHGWKPIGADAKARMPPLSVAKEFHAADKKEGKYMHYADGGKVGTMVDFARAGTKALMNRIEGAFHNPYTADTNQLRQDVAKYWQTNAPAAIAKPVKAPEPSIDDLTAQLHDLASKSYADGGAVDDAPPKRRGRAPPSASKGVHVDPMQLISHAADRVSAAVSDDPHHMLARIAGGLSSQLAGLSPSGRAEFGRVPGLVDEAKSLPAGLADAGHAVADLGGAAADAAQARGYQAPGLAALQGLRGGIDNLMAKYGGNLDWSRQAGERADKLHSAVNKQMGLAPPQGFAEHAADAAGTMLGQVPIVGQEEKAASMLAKLLKSPIEFLSPSIRPKLSNYAVGTLAGAAMGAGGDRPQQPVADNSAPIQERFE